MTLAQYNTLRFATIWLKWKTGLITALFVKGGNLYYIYIFSFFIAVPPKPKPTPKPTSKPTSKPGPHVATIVGIVVGVLVLILIIVVVLYYCKKRASKLFPYNTQLMFISTFTE